LYINKWQELNFVKEKHNISIFMLDLVHMSLSAKISRTFLTKEQYFSFTANQQQQQKKHYAVLVLYYWQ